MKKWDDLSELEKTPYLDQVANTVDCLYWCTRTWEAWYVGTMQPNDFVLIADDDDFIDIHARALYDFTVQQSFLSRLKARISYCKALVLVRAWLKRTENK